MYEVSAARQNAYHSSANGTVVSGKQKPVQFEPLDDDQPPFEPDAGASLSDNHHANRQNKENLVAAFGKGAGTQDGALDASLSPIQRPECTAKQERVNTQACDSSANDSQTQSDSNQFLPSIFRRSRAWSDNSATDASGQRMSFLQSLAKSVLQSAPENKADPLEVEHPPVALAEPTLTVSLVPEYNEVRKAYPTPNLHL